MCPDASQSGPHARRLSASISDEIACHLRTARDALCGHPHLEEAAVHTARKTLKKIRAGLRLLEDAGAEVPAGSTALCRDVGRVLSELRDTDVCLQTLARLYPAPEEAPDGLVTKLKTRRAELHETDTPGSDARQAIAMDLEGLERILLGVHRKKARDKPIKKALEKTRAIGRKRYSKLGDSPSPERFHDLRKAAKRELYQGRYLLRGAAPDKRMETVHRLTEHLGLQQDLVVLGQVAEALDELSADLADRIDNGIRAEKEKAMTLAKKVYGKRH
ncbi:MAG: CHAD domain-containing protein [Chromatiales bacterium]|jgi:CHAD domain-containing protein|nr:CHAD domain-containing protein [Chromatiales bacterium]MDH4031950.1 CHAD domain-containing protein [Chromatiales bacterium]